MGPDTLEMEARDTSRAGALAAATQAIAGLLSLDDALQVIVDRVRPLVSAQYAALGITRPDGTLERFVTSGIDVETRRRIGPLPRGHGLLGLIIRENRSFRIADIGMDERRSGFPPHHPEMHTFLGVPVTVKGRSVGNLYLTSKESGQEFTAEDQALVETFALHAGIAMENAQLHDQLQRLAVVEERDRISRDLHDGIIQNLYAVGLSLEDVPELMTESPDDATARVERAIDSIHSSIRDIRNFIVGLRPESLDASGLVEGLHVLVEEASRNVRSEIELDAPSNLRSEPDERVTAELLAIANEAISNAVRHARASRIRIELAEDRGRIRLGIFDDGIGFTPGTTAPGQHGLANMRGRSEALGGRLAVEAAPGNGTRIVVEIEERRRRSVGSLPSSPRARPTRRSPRRSSSPTRPSRTTSARSSRSSTSSAGRRRLPTSPSTVHPPGAADQRSLTRAGSAGPLTRMRTSGSPIPC